jgi:hypothetical protein
MAISATYTRTYLAADPCRVENISRCRSESRRGLAGRHLRGPTGALSAIWRDQVEQTRYWLTRLRDTWTFIGCGCLSIDRCNCANPLIGCVRGADRGALAMRRAPKKAPPRKLPQIVNGWLCGGRLDRDVTSALCRVDNKCDVPTVLGQHQFCLSPHFALPGAFPIQPLNARMKLFSLQKTPRPGPLLGGR